MSDLNDLLKNIDAKTLKEGMEKAAIFAKTEEGKAFIAKIQKGDPKDKASLSKLLSNNPDIMKSVEKFFNK